MSLDQSPALDPPRAKNGRVEATGVAPVGSGLDGPALRLLPPSNGSGVYAPEPFLVKQAVIGGLGVFNHLTNGRGTESRIGVRRNDRLR